MDQISLSWFFWAKMICGGGGTGARGSHAGPLPARRNLAERRRGRGAGVASSGEAARGRCRVGMSAAPGVHLGSLGVSLVHQVTLLCRLL